jgi:type IV pilus assembly protein PilN
MIRINLLGVDRAKARKAPAFDVGQQLTLLCSVILVAAALGIGWWYWTLNGEATRVEAEIAAAQREQTRLASLLTEVTQFEAQRAQLQQRVGLIEQLRAGQSVPVQLLDHVSRSIPEMLWLTEMDQTGEALTIQGRSTTLMAVSRLVGNLGGSDLLVKPIEIVATQVEPVAAGAGQAAVDVIRFTVRANIKKPEAPKPVAAAAPAAPAPGGRVGG